MTVCIRNRVCLCGAIVDGGMRLNACGQIVQAAWDDLPNHYPGVELDAFVVMPNHVHGIIVLTDIDMVTGARRHGLPEIVRAFKTFSARRINEHRGAPGTAVWQRNYYEHIIRDERSLNRIRQYIADNPLRWEYDRENPDATMPEREDAWLG